MKARIICGVESHRMHEGTYNLWPCLLFYVETFQIDNFEFEANKHRKKFRISKLIQDSNNSDIGLLP